MQTVKQGSRPIAGNSFIQTPCSLSQVKSLYCEVGSPNQYRVMKDSKTGLDYKVPLGKKLLILSVTSSNAGSGTHASVGVGYGDNSVSGSTPPTNFKGPVLAIQLGNYGVQGYNSHILFEVPSEKFPHGYFNEGQGSLYTAIEVPV